MFREDLGWRILPLAGGFRGDALVLPLCCCLVAVVVRCSAAAVLPFVHLRWCRGTTVVLLQCRFTVAISAAAAAVMIDCSSTNCFMHFLQSVEQIL